eukprot:6918575-Pyramimonas_sp.AAC.1
MQRVGEFALSRINASGRKGQRLSDAKKQSLSKEKAMLTWATADSDNYEYYSQLPILLRVARPVAGSSELHARSEARAAKRTTCARGSERKANDNDLATTHY